MKTQNLLNGKCGEYRVASELLLKGYNVFMPSVDNGSDLLLGNDIHIQVKSSSAGNYSFISAVSKRNRRKHGDEYSLEPDLLKNIDIIILWDMISSEFYIIPADKIRGNIRIDAADISGIWNSYLNNWSVLGIKDFDIVNGSALGKAGEYRVLSEMLLRDYDIVIPVLESGIDIIADKQKRIQIKTAKPHNINDIKHPHRRYIFNFKLSKNTQEYEENTKIKPHPLTDVDYVMLWAVDDGFYIIPANEIRGISSIGFTADHDKRTKKKWNRWLPYRNNWEVLKGILPEKVGGKEFTCNQCGHKWTSFVDNPTRCPKCNSRWRIKRDRKIVDGKIIPLSKEERNAINKLECSRVRWAKFREDKKKEGAREIICQQCGWLWYPVVENPTKCPHCHCRWYIKRERQIIDGKPVLLTSEQRSKMRSEISSEMWKKRRETAGVKG